MFLYKDIIVPSGFVEKRLRHLLKTCEKPDPPKFLDRIENLGVPEDLYRVQWISPERFIFKCFRYIDSRNYTGYTKIDQVQVQIEGPADHPVLRIHLPKAWYTFLKLFFVFILLLGFYWLLLFNLF